VRSTRAETRMPWTRKRDGQSMRGGRNEERLGGDVIDGTRSGRKGGGRAMRSLVQSPDMMPVQGEKAALIINVKIQGEHQVQYD
jgi:hypothetical protein